MISTNQQQRKFFLSIGLVLVVLGGVKSYQGKFNLGVTLIGFSLLLTCAEFFLPSIAKKLFTAWMRFAHILGTINTVVIISLAYWLLLTPIGWFRRVVLGVRRKEYAGFQSRQSSFLPLEGPSDQRRYYSSF